jgi:hypothetical protein
MSETKIILVGGKFQLSDESKDFSEHSSHFKCFIVETIAVPLHFADQIPLIHEVLRVHAFGNNGDLTIRRDEGTIYWRYVGDEIKDFGGNLYPYALKLGYERKSLLWGANPRESDGKRYEGRVGGAKLNYPINSNSEAQAELIAREVFDETTHEVVAIWTQEIRLHKEEK